MLADIHQGSCISSLGKQMGKLCFIYCFCFFFFMKWDALLCQPALRINFCAAYNLPVLFVFFSSISLSCKALLCWAFFIVLLDLRIIIYEGIDIKVHPQIFPWHTYVLISEIQLGQGIILYFLLYGNGVIVIHSFNIMSECKKLRNLKNTHFKSLFFLYQSVLHNIH